MSKTIKTPFHYITPHSVDAGDSFKPWNWKAPMKTGDTLYLWNAMYSGFSRKTITRFVRDTDFDGTPGALFFVSDDNTAYSVSQLKDHVIKRADGSWVYASTGGDASAYATRYNVESNVI